MSIEIFENFPIIDEYLDKLAKYLFPKRYLPEWVKPKKFYTSLKEQIWKRLLINAKYGNYHISHIEDITCQLISRYTDIGALGDRDAQFERDHPKLIVPDEIIEEIKKHIDIKRV